MICIGNLKKKSFISVVSVAKLKNIVVFAITYVLKVFPCIMAISAWISVVLTAMKR
jgi:hypothetical protein